MSKPPNPTSWIDSYEDLQTQRQPNASGHAATTTLEPIVVNTATARQLLGGIDEKTLRDWRHQGHLDGAWFKQGNKVMFCVTELRRAVQRLCGTSTLTPAPYPSH